MGMLAKADIQSRRLGSRAPRGSGRSVSVRVEVTEDTLKLLEQLPWQIREKVLKSAVRDAGRVVVNAARAKLRAHRSSRTGTQTLWSKKLREKRASRRWDLYQSIGQRVQVYERTVVAFIGARWPWGAHAHLLERGGVFRRWGKTSTYQPPRPFLRPAVNETRPQQNLAMISRVKREWKNV